MDEDNGHKNLIIDTLVEMKKRGWITISGGFEVGGIIMAKMAAEMLGIDENDTEVFEEIAARLKEAGYK